MSRTFRDQSSFYAEVHSVPEVASESQTGESTLWDEILELCPAEHREMIEMKRQGVPVSSIAARTGLHPESIRWVIRILARQVTLKLKPLSDYVPRAD